MSSSQPPRPPSPTELSYTQLAKLAPRFGSANSQKNVQESISARKPPSLQYQHANNNTTTPSTGIIMSNPQTAPPATIDVPSSMDNRSVDGSSIEGGRAGNATLAMRNNDVSCQAAAESQHYQTPQAMQNHMPMSAPMQYNTRPMNIPHQGMTMMMVDPMNDRSTPVEDRLYNLATKLMQQQQQDTTPADQSNLYTPMINNSQKHYQQHYRFNRLNEVHQFIDTLKNMQLAVVRTADEQQRVKKSRALNALLSMFERIIEDSNHHHETRVRMDPSTENTIKQLQQRVQQLEEENNQLKIHCQEKDRQMQQMSNELQSSQQNLQHLANVNEQLKNDLTSSQEQSHQERLRATEAEQIASESENVRDNMLSNYARLTEENVELQQSMHDVNLEKKKMVTEFELCQQEMNHLQTQVHQLTQQVQRKELDIIEVEKKMNDLNDQLISQRNLLQSANNDQQRLQDELHNSQRNSTTASEQLMQLRGQFSHFRRESDSRQGREGPNESEYDLHSKKLQEEQQRRRILEMSMSKSTNRRDMAQEEIQRISQANADLKSKVDELNAQLNLQSIVRPRSQRSSIVDEFSLNGTMVDSFMNDHLGNTSSPLSLDTSQQTELSNQQSIAKGKVTDQQQDSTPSSAKPRNHLSAIDEFSLGEVDSIMNVHQTKNECNIDTSPESQSASQQRKEDTHPNLMDYFYHQLKLA